MTLRKDTLIVIGMTLICLVTFLYITSSAILVGGFSQLEQQEMEKNVQRTEMALSDDISSLNGDVGDWATWDETYNFIENGNPDYIERNIPDTTFIEIRLNLMLFVNSTGGIVFGRGFDLQNRTELPIPPSFKDISANSILLHHADKESSIKGILLLPEGPMIIASRPILDNQRNGPIRGSLIWGRYLNDAEIERLSEITHLSININRLDDASSVDLVEVRNLTKDKPILIRALSEQSVAGYTLLRDIYGNPNIALRVDMPRDIYNQGMLSVRYIFYSLIFLGLIFGVMSIILLEKLILSRLASLNSDVSSIGESRELSSRVTMEGKDELSSLASAINRMLEALERFQEERAVVEEELKNHRDHLEDIVEERTLELQTANKKLVDEMNERKKADENLRNSEEKYRSLVESTDDFIYMVDRDCNYLFINSKYLKKLGITDYMGRNYRDFHSVNETNRFTQSVSHVFNTGLPEQHEYEYEGVWRSQTLSPSKDPKTGDVTAVTIISTDITGRKRIEKIRIENDRLAFANRAKSEFLANMSHELRTPLNSIIGFSELMKYKKAGELNEKQEHYIDNVITSSKFLLALINDILDLSKVEAGKLELFIEKLSVPETLDEVLILIMERAKKHNVEIKKDFDRHLDFIDADKQRFKQILFNLLNNAVKFSKKEGGTVTITTKKEGETARFSISDTGIGIKEEDIGRLFNTFEQIDSGITRNYGGTGLGLAISKGLVELHGGKIYAESKYGVGTTFTFSLPISKRTEG